MGLSEVLDRYRVVVAVGSGGVGKTTTSAAMALHAAVRGRRVLCLTIDPARRLANSLGLSEMTTSEQDVPAALFEKHGLKLRGSLSAMMLDTKRTFDELVGKYASSPEARDRILNNQVYQYVASSLAGTQEYMAMEKLHEVRQDESWDLIVLDTPPTTNALDFLDAPERLIDAIDSQAMRWFVQVFEGAGRAGFGLARRGATVMLKGLARITGLEFLEQVSEFVSGINDMFGGFKDRATEISNAFRGEDVGFVLVTSPDPLAVQEAAFFAKKLDDAGMHRKAVVINQMHQTVEMPTADEQTLKDELAKLVPGDPEPTLRKLQRALEDEQNLGLRDRKQADRLEHELSGVIEVPAFDEDVHDIAALARVAQYLSGSAA